MRAAFEAEFVVVDGTDPGALLVDTGRMFSVEQLDERWPMAARILADLDAAGVDVHQIAKEYGPGQYEVSLLPADALDAADRFLLARQLIQLRRGRTRRPRSCRSRTPTCRATACTSTLG